MNLLYVKWTVSKAFCIYLQASMAMIGRIDDTPKLLSENLKEN